MEFLLIFLIEQTSVSYSANRQLKTPIIKYLATITPFSNKNRNYE
jgi:hypothetical protein